MNLWLLKDVLCPLTTDSLVPPLPPQHASGNIYCYNYIEKNYFTLIPQFQWPLQSLVQSRAFDIC